jgi:dienelactone hydrolase
MKGTPTELQWPDYTPCGGSVLAANAAPDWRQAIIGYFANRGSCGVYVVLHSFLALLAVPPAACQTEKPIFPPVGQIVDVICEGDAAQSYALYLPSTYVPGKPWPVIYFFDPGGRGRRPLELYKDLGEKYGFIMAASNNSRNFSTDQSHSVNAIWLDTHRLLAIDSHLTYVSGFSGGARVAGLMALTCPQCQIAGVIAHGAGYPSNHGETKDKLLYFFAVGDQDFNWSEVMMVRRDREDNGLPYRVRVFPGPHQWAPAPIMEDAIEWMILRAMQSGDRPKDPAIIDQQLRRAQTEAEDAEKKQDAIAQLNAYRSLVTNFSSLKDTSEAEKKLVSLKKSAALKAALKSEDQEMEEQSALEGEVSAKLHTYMSGRADDEVTLGNAIVQEMRQLNDQAEHSKNEVKRLIARRAFGEVWVSGIETGQQELAARHFDRAEACFELMSKVSDSPWPALLLADTYASQRNKKEAIRELKEVVRRGLKDAEVIESDDWLQVLKTDPDFQKIVQALKANRPIP